MKKLRLFAAFVAVLSLTECGEKDNTAAYNWNLAVKNATDKDIVIENYATGAYGVEAVTIAPGQSGSVGGLLYLGRADNNTPMPDIFEAEDTLPFGDATAMLLPDGDYWVEMTVGGKAVSGKVWTRKHWSFTSDNFSCTYSLTVTDEFLAGLDSPEPGQ